MENEAGNAPEVNDACEQARNHLLRLTSEYYSLRAQCNSHSLDQNSQGNSQDMRNVLIVDRLEEIARETKKLLPSIYPQIEIGTSKPAALQTRRSRTPSSTLKAK